MTSDDEKNRILPPMMITLLGKPCRTCGANVVYIAGEPSFCSEECVEKLVEKCAKEMLS